MKPRCLSYPLSIVMYCIPLSFAFSHLYSLSCIIVKYAFNQSLIHIVCHTYSFLNPLSSIMFCILFSVFSVLCTMLSPFQSNVLYPVILLSVMCILSCTVSQPSSTLMYSLTCFPLIFCPFYSLCFLSGLYSPSYHPSSVNFVFCNICNLLFVLCVLFCLCNL